jgi:L-threonylcarbamoyladenylate synthase
MRILRPTQRSTEAIVADVAACVRAGGTVIFPTETVYGIGCDPDNDTAVDAIYAAKARSERKPLALHVTSLAQAAPFVARFTELAQMLIDAFWPGPLAIVVEREPTRARRAACSFPTISLRCPDDELCQAILAGSGPLAATSANRSGAPAYAGDPGREGDLPQADLAVLAGLTKLCQESTIVDCTRETPLILREGAIASGVIAARMGTSRARG